MSKTKNCKYCQSEISPKAKICPVCRKKQGGGLLKKIGIGFLVFIFLGVIANMFGNGNSSSNNQTNQTVNSTNNTANATTQTTSETPKEKYYIDGDVTEEKDSFALYLTGVLVNNSDREASYVQIIFNLYDKDGNQIGTAIDNINNLKAGGTWKFKATSLGVKVDEIGSWELSEITGF